MSYDFNNAAPQTTNGGSTALVRANTAPVPAVSRGAVASYLDEVAPAAIVGRLLKFDKNGNFSATDDGETIGDDIDFVALVDQTLVGWLKFNEQGPPDRAMGLLYDGFVMPPRASLGDTDEAAWPAGLDSRPADPWQHTQYLVLQRRDTDELYTFTTSSKTGRRAVGNLLRHYDRMHSGKPQRIPRGAFEKGRVRAQGHSNRLGRNPGLRRGWSRTEGFCGRA